MIRLLVALVFAAVLGPLAAHAAPEGQMTWAVHVSIAPTWFDPAEAPGLLTPYLLF
jgi:peptide/nickel transport system substrate-binding protein